MSIVPIIILGAFCTVVVNSQLTQNQPGPRHHGWPPAVPFPPQPPPMGGRVPQPPRFPEPRPQSFGSGNSGNPNDNKGGDSSSEEDHGNGKDKSNDEDSVEWWVILLGVLGGIAALIIISCTFYCCCCRKQKRTTAPAQVNDNAAYDVKVEVKVAPPTAPAYAYGISRSGSMVKVAPYDGPPAGDPPMDDRFGGSPVPPPPYDSNAYSTIPL